MRFVDHDPVRPATPRAQLLEPRQQLLEEGRTVGDADAEHVDDRILVGLFEQVHNRVDTWLAIRVAQRDRALKRLAIALRVDDTELVLLRGQPLQNRGRNRRLAGSGRAYEQQVGAVGLEIYLLLVIAHARAKQDLVTFPT